MSDPIAGPVAAGAAQDPAQTPGQRFAAQLVVNVKPSDAGAQNMTAVKVETIPEPVGPCPYEVQPTSDAQTALAVKPKEAPTVANGGRSPRGHLLPGHKGIPGSGRPKGLAARVRQIVDFDKAIETLVEIAWGRLAPSARMADRIKAIEILFDRGHGKPQVTVDIKEGGAVSRDKLRGMDYGRLVGLVEGMRQLAGEGSDEDVTDAEEVQ